MNILPRDRQIQIIAALTEGCSIRAVERLTGVHRDTIMRLGVRVGEGCAAVHDGLMRGLNVARIEMDEVWSYVAKKQRLVTREDGAEVGDQYLFVAMDATGKAILSYAIGKRTAEMTNAFVADLRTRVINRPQIHTDGFQPYINAIEWAFGIDVDFGQIVKHYAIEGVATPEAARRYSPAPVASVQRTRITGNPTRIGTSHVERSNLTLRMQSRRFTRLTNGFSKKLRNHKAAIALYVAHYNLCRVHEALRITPAMALGVTDHIWSIDELVDTANTGALPEPAGRRVGRFTVIDGGVS